MDGADVLREGYSRVRLTQLVIALAVAVLVVWLCSLGWEISSAAIALGLLAGYPFGAWRWARTRPRIDKRNVLILYFSDSGFILLLIVLYAFKSFPLAAGWAALQIYSHAIVVMSMMIFVASFWFGYDAALLRGVMAHEREHGPIRRKRFHSRSVTGQQGMIGLTGRVFRTCAPDGKVEVRGEFWNAVSIDRSEIPEGRKVVIRDIEEMTLIVEEVAESRESSRSP